MYYEEKIINGVLHYRTHPKGEWLIALTAHAAAVNVLAKLTDEERMRAFSLFCTHCGCDNPQCKCWNDD